MSVVETTDADTIRLALATEIKTISPRFQARRSDLWTWTKDQEIAGGGSMRTFDVIIQAESDVPEGWYSGGIELQAVCEIRVSYPVSEPAIPRFMGADAQDLSGILVDFHIGVPGIFATPMGGDVPIFEKARNGKTGAYVGSYFTTLHWFASDQVARVA